jgi:acetate kinase
MPADDASRILTINSGSSSLKIALFRLGKMETLELSAKIERIGLPAAHCRIARGDGTVLLEETRALPDHAAALKAVLDWLRERSIRLAGVGHRIVHGGTRYGPPARITPRMEKALAELEPLDPDHLPNELDAIRTIRRRHARLSQVACFDTAFHRSMPAVARRYPLPRNLWREGVRRFGFHGLSYEFILGELARVAGARAARGRVIVAHLGNGASLAAVREGRSVETTMGFTPAGGVMMSTRSGDLDPGVLIYLLREKHRSAAALDRLVNHEAGLLGVSGTSPDVRDLLARAAGDPCAEEAIGMFCYQVRKSLGALAATLGGVDTLIFTAGIGENSPEIRARICAGLEFLGIRLDAARNRRNAAIVSRVGRGVTVRVMKTNEELTIARHTRDLLRL